ncbi:hypothetical protein F4677DRAFT_432633 [Hypoxylon crocopeplum]|nr:hypothetical protein F4677DRAFT_432633 [Hypoxylon crocopeplum]
MESSQGGVEPQAIVDRGQPYQLDTILRSIDELVVATLALNETITQQHAASSDDDNDTSLRSGQSALLKEFKDLMVAVQSKASKATHELETKLGIDAQLIESPLKDLAGVGPGSELNRILGCTPLGAKQSYKLRDLSAGTPSPLLITDDGTAQQNPSGPVIVLQPTLRNVWVVQHAYMKLLNHKEKLIKQYLDAADPSAGVSRKFSREYYEDLSLANLPSKNKLGNLLDVKPSSYNDASHDMEIILLFVDLDGNFQYVEPVTGNTINIDRVTGSNTYLVLPVAEASIKKLYDVYRSLRKATSDQRRATKDREFAAKLPVDEMDELEKQFNFTGGDVSAGANGSSSKKRRRMLDDDDTA